MLKNRKKDLTRNLNCTKGENSWSCLLWSLTLLSQIDQVFVIKFCVILDIVIICLMWSVWLSTTGITLNSFTIFRKISRHFIRVKKINNFLKLRFCKMYYTIRIFSLFLKRRDISIASFQQSKVHLSSQYFGFQGFAEKTKLNFKNNYIGKHDEKKSCILKKSEF